jgi:acylphosphatase
MDIAREIVVRGRVQGVNFRYSAKQEAVKCGLSGTIENCDDGSVMIFVEGEEEVVEKFLHWCRSGPSRAVVEGVEIRELGLKGLPGFSIVR